MEDHTTLWRNLNVKEENVRVIAPGIVFFKGVLNEEHQVKKMQQYTNIMFLIQNLI